MITLALDSASDRCTVAATDGSTVAHRVLDGSRGHATAILSLLEAVLLDVGARVTDVERLVTGDGPGSFTGLRVATSVAKAIVWGRDVAWHVAPSLLVRAAGVAQPGETVVALSDALRGDLYAGCWHLTADAVTTVGGAPRAMRPEQLAELGAVQRVVGSVPPSLLEAVQAATGCAVTGGTEALPDARQLLRLVDLRGGATLVADPAAWEPEYGRPAEAQAVWEKRHGRLLPHTPGIAR